MPKKKKNNKNKKSKQIIMSVLAIIVIFVTIGIMSLLFNTSYAAEIASGTSGTCIWNIDADGKLTIEPDGTSTCTLKSTFTSSDVPWYDYRTNVTSVEVKDGTKTNTNAVGLLSGMANATSMDVNNLDTSSAKNMTNMFSGCSSLTSLDVTNFNTSSATNMSYMFVNCRSLTSLDLTSFNTSSVTYMHDMFSDCSSLTELDVSSFNTSSVTNMFEMFGNCSSLTSLDVTNFNTSSVTSMTQMFSGCSSLTSLDVTNFNTSSVTTMTSMFNDCKSLTSLDVTHFNTNSVTSMGQMFSGCSSLTSIDVTHFNTSSATDMDYMFSDCSSLTSLDVTHFNTSSVTDMGYMFKGCSSLTSLDVTNFNTSSVTRMYNMFKGCSSLTSLDVTHFNTSSVTNMGYMFADCNSLTELDLSKFDTSAITSATGVNYMFYNIGKSNNQGCKLILNNTFNNITYAISNGYKFPWAYWAKVENGSTGQTLYSLTDMQTEVTGSATPTTWVPAYSVTYDKGVGTSVSGSPNPQVYRIGENINTIGYSAAKENATFYSWNTALTGRGTAFETNTASTTAYGERYVTSYLTNGNLTLYAKYKYIATIYYQSNSTSGITTISTASTECSLSSSSSCSAQIPSEAKSSVGTYNNAYAGLAANTGTMSTAVSSSASSITLTGSNNYYAVYSTNVKNYYYGTSYTNRTLYRNQWFVSESSMESPVLSTSSTGATNYSAEAGPGNSTWYGLSNEQDTTREYSSIDSAAKSDNTTLYTIYQYDVTYEKGSNVANIGSQTGNCLITTSSTSCKVILPSITADTGYESVGWNTTNGATTGTAAGLNYTISSNNTKLYANAKASKFVPTIAKTIENEKSLYKTGDTITYNIKVTNNETFAITNVVVSDPNGEIINAAGYTVNNSHQATISSIAAGASVIVKATKTITTSDVNTVTNTATITEAEAANGATLEGAPSASKTSNVQNVIKITKQVKGNMAKLNEYFKVKVVIGGATGDKYTISGQSYTGEGKQTTYTVGEDNYIYLKSGETVTIGEGASDSRILAGTIYQVVESSNDYNTYINGSSTNSKDSGDLTTSTTNNTNEVSIINTKEAVVPTGKKVRYIPYLIVGLIILIPVIILKIRP